MTEFNNRNFPLTDNGNHLPKLYSFETLTILQHLTNDTERRFSTAGLSQLVACFNFLPSSFPLPVPLLPSPPFGFPPSPLRPPYLN